MKTLRKLIPAIIISGVTLLYACGGFDSASSSDTTSSAAPAKTADVDPAAKSDSKGIGKFTSVQLGPIDAAMAAKGQAVFTTKCSACHKTTDQKVVGPGLKGVTERRTPEWIMNQITNPVEMEQKDPVGQALLAQHLTQMTFQNVSDDETRQILEFLRQNDKK
ncbi:MAG TPA: cytochrome c [Mucilaginibacter sp.]|nr:cytochrome c [Mucilaginibacter sp.]